MDSTTFEYAERLPNSIFEENRRNFLKAFKSMVPNYAKAIIFMQGKGEVPIDSTDDNYEVIQESCFYYLFGVQEVNFHACIEVDTEKVTLFAPKVSVITRVFQSPPRKTDIAKKYGVSTYYQSKMENFLTEYNPSSIYLLSGINLMSQKKIVPPQYPYLYKYPVNMDVLYPLICRCRAQKNPGEISVMKTAVEASSKGHVEMMRKCKTGMRESQLMGYFRDQGLFGYNSKFKPYPDIIASGPNAAILHYEINNRILEDKELVLCDCAYRVGNYCADITTTFPSNGKFTEYQKYYSEGWEHNRNIYELVLSINRKIQAMLAPGISWMTMETLCSEMLLEGLKNLNIVKGELKDLMANRVYRLFMPHSLGHLLGLDPHDVGIECLFAFPGALQEGMVVTVEPGCYFIPMMFTRGAKEWKIPLHFLDMEKVEAYMKEVGGVRIEDDIFITKTGAVNYSKVPRTVEEIETCMAGGNWEKVANK